MRLSHGPVRPRMRALKMAWRYTFGLLLAAFLSQTTPGQAMASETEVQTVWRLLDYVAVDYTGAVSGGRVISEAEYAAMVEFAGQVETRLGTLPEKSGKAALLRQAMEFRVAHGATAPPPDVHPTSTAPPHPRPPAQP